MADTNTAAVVDTAALLAEIERLKSENATLAATPKVVRGLTCKVSEKSGCLSVYGLGRFPVSLYKGQWQRLIANVQVITDFIAAHPELTDKSA